MSKKLSFRGFMHEIDPSLHVSQQNSSSVDKPTQESKSWIKKVTTSVPANLSQIAGKIEDQSNVLHSEPTNASVEIPKEVSDKLLKTSDESKVAHVVNEINQVFVTHNDAPQATQPAAPHETSNAENDRLLLYNIKEGKGAAAVAYIKGQTKLEAGKISQSVVYGPQERSHETEIMEGIVKGLLADPPLNYQVVQVPEKNEWHLIAPDGSPLKDSDNKPIDFKEFIKKVDFNHISLTDSELKSFEHMLIKDNADVPGFMLKKDIKQNPALSDQGLSTAEKGAINLYSGNSYYAMQALMRGRLNVPKLDNPDKINKALLTAVVAAMGLNKLPNFKNKESMESPNKTYLYRNEKNTPKSEIDNRIEAVRAGGGVTNVVGFLSTSHTAPSEDFIEGRGVYTIYENCKGKLIQELSNNEHEQEVLIPPTQVQWTGYHKIVDDNGNTIHVFTAKAVTAGTYEGRTTRDSNEEITDNLPPPK